MKKIVIALVLTLGFVVAGSVSAQEVATSTPLVGGRPHAVVVGSRDSIHNKGAWVLENAPGQLAGKISYLSEATGAELVRLTSIFNKWIGEFSDHASIK